MADRSIAVHLRAQVAQFKRGMAEAEGSTKSVMRQLTALDATGEKTRRGLNTVGDSAGRMALATAAGLTLAGKAATDWESAWAGVLKTVDGTDEQLQQLEDGLREMARTLPASHQEIAAVAEAAGQLGVATEDVDEFTETMIALGETTNLTAEDAATSIARFTNIMGTAPDEVENIGSALVDLGNNSATTEAEILTLGQRLAAAGAIAGLAESDVLAFASTLTSVGVEAEAGGTALSKVFTSMRDAAIDGGEDLETFAEVAGVSAEEFQRQWGDDPASAVNMFIQGLGRMNAAGESTSQVFDALSLTDQRLMRALLSTAEAGDLLTDSLELGAEAYGENAALAEEFEKRLGTTASEVRVAWNNIKDAGIEAGEVLLPLISEGADLVSGMAQAFAALPEPVQNSVVALGGLVTVFGGGLWFTAKTVNAVTNMKGALADLGVQSGKTRVSLAGLAKTGVVAAGLLAATEATNRLRDTVVGAAPEVDALAAALASTDTAAIADEFGGSIAGALDAIDTSSLEDLNVKASDAVDSLGYAGDAIRAFSPSLGHAADNVHKAEQAFESLDDSLSILAATSPEQAAKAFDALAEAEGLTADETEALRDQLPAFTSAMDAVSDSVDGVSTALEGSGEAAGFSAEALEESRDAARETADSFIDLGDSLNDGEKSLTDWIAELERNAKALREFQENAQTAARRGLDEGLIASLEDAGEAGALRMGQLADATDEEIARANEAWRTGQGQINDYINAVGGVPPIVGTEVKVDTSSAMAKLTGVKAIMDAINAGGVKPDIGTSTYDPTLAGTVPQANGGVLDFYANGGMRREDHVAQIAPAGAWRVWAEPETGGEAYIPLAMSKRDRSLEVWAETGRRLGALESFARGAVSSPLVPMQPTGGAMGPAIDYDRLAAGIARETARVTQPLYGPVHVYGDESFERKMRETKQKQGIGGVR